MKNTRVHIVTCIVCPVGCKARITLKDGQISDIENVECPRGEEYVVNELQAPQRDFFTVIKVRGGRIPVLPVRSTQPIPKDQMLNCAQALANVVVDSPIEAGELIMQNILGLGVDIISTRAVNQEEK